MIQEMTHRKHKYNGKILMKIASFEFVTHKRKACAAIKKKREDAQDDETQLGGEDRE